ncbi:MAG: hypothetical protein HGA46_03005 [Chlorobiaceae bacterium]|nr:hypothetical protein [Chlorobiaceae bacterium]
MKRSLPVCFRTGACLFVLVLMVMTSACSTSQHYVKLSEAGSAYTGSVAALADRASLLHVEASSYELLDQRLDDNGRVMPKSRLKDLLNNTNSSDSKAVERNLRTKKVALNLQDYFKALQEHAASTASSDIGIKADGLVKKLNEAIRDAGGTLPSGATGLSGVVALAAKHQREAILKKELIVRKQSIISALHIFHEMDSLMTNQIAGDADTIRRGRLKMLITPFYTDGNASMGMNAELVDAWVSRRRDHLLGSITEKENRQLTDTAKKNADTFREIFIKMTSNQERTVTIDDLNALIDDCTAFSGFIKSF